MRLDAHLARLAASVAALYGGGPRGAAMEGGAASMAEAAALVARAAAEVGDGRVRVDARPERGGVALSVATGPLPRSEGRVELAPVCLPGGLGRHKWADRRLLDALAEVVAPAVPLLVDLDGLVLEAAYANVVIVEGDACITPPDDGRILPGIGLRSLDVRAEPIDLDRLERADAVLLVNALRGVQVVRGRIAATISSGAASSMSSL